MLGQGNCCLKPQQVVRQPLATPSLLVGHGVRPKCRSLSITPLGPTLAPAWGLEPW